MAKFEREVEVRVPPPILPGGVSIERDVPVRVPEIHGDVLVPLFWSLITAMMLACIALVACLWWKLPAILALGVFALAEAVVWYEIIFKWDWKKLWRAEEHTKAANTVSGPEPTITIEKIGRNAHGSTYDYARLGMTAQELKLLADGIITEGKTLGEDQWCGKHKPFSKARYHMIMSALHAHEYIDWRNPDYPTQGRELTVDGVQLLTEIATGNPQISSTIDAERGDE